VDSVQNSKRDTAMVHYSCRTCGVTATCVATPSAVLAWLDHMECHAVRDNYDAWTWVVQQLDL
jgi:hypothetical protein